jgi:hypothetical protein
MLAAFMVKRASEPHFNVGITGCKSTASLILAVLRLSCASICSSSIGLFSLLGGYSFIILCYFDLRFFALSAKRYIGTYHPGSRAISTNVPFSLAGFCGKSRFCTTFRSSLRRQWLMRGKRVDGQATQWPLFLASLYAGGTHVLPGLYLPSKISLGKYRNTCYLVSHGAFACTHCGASASPQLVLVTQTFFSPVGSFVPRPLPLRRPYTQRHSCPVHQAPVLPPMALWRPVVPPGMQLSPLVVKTISAGGAITNEQLVSVAQRFPAPRQQF